MSEEKTHTHNFPVILTDGFMILEIALQVAPQKLPRATRLARKLPFIMFTMIKVID
jgi:hypothetical protein